MQQILLTSYKLGAFFIYWPAQGAAKTLLGMGMQRKLIIYKNLVYKIFMAHTSCRGFL